MLLHESFKLEHKSRSFVQFQAKHIIGLHAVLLVLLAVVETETETEDEYQIKIVK